MQISPEEEDGVDYRKFISIICICADKIGNTFCWFLLSQFNHTLLYSCHFNSDNLFRPPYCWFYLIEIGNGRKMKFVF
jgi:hypothetical protein